MALLKKKREQGAFNHMLDDVFVTKSQPGTESTAAAGPSEETLASSTDKAESIEPTRSLAQSTEVQKWLRDHGSLKSSGHGSETRVGQDKMHVDQAATSNGVSQEVGVSSNHDVDMDAPVIQGQVALE